MAKTQSRGKKRKSDDAKERELIVIDEEAGLIFESDKELEAYFEAPIEALEDEYQGLRGEGDYTDDEQIALEGELEEALDDPDEVWRDEKLWPEGALHVFLRVFEEFTYVAVAYVSSEEEPTFVLIHFPTRDPEMVRNYQRGTLVYSRAFEQVLPGAIDGDALSDGDELAMGLYVSMLKLRSDKDVPQEDFQKYGGLREDSIEEPDEIWRKNDLHGNTLVCFIKEFPDHELGEVTYVTVTLEDPESQVHSLLFSFPTKDSALVDRYRQGENLQAEEVVQENSH